MEDTRSALSTKHSNVPGSAEFRITVGIPGSGKTTLASEWLRSGEVDVVVSSDLIREELTGDPANQTHNRHVWNTVYERIRDELGRGMRVCLDATGIQPRDRRKALGIGEELGIEVSAYIVRTPILCSLARNMNRDRVVPQHIMERMVDEYIMFCDADRIRKEGFNVVEVEQ